MNTSDGDFVLTPKMWNMVWAVLAETCPADIVERLRQRVFENPWIKTETGYETAIFLRALEEEFGIDFDAIVRAANARREQRLEDLEVAFDEVDEILRSEDKG